MLQAVTKQVLEAAPAGGIDDHLGYVKHAVKGSDHGKSRNGTRTKTVYTELGLVEVDISRYRDGTFSLR